MGEFIVLSLLLFLLFYFMLLRPVLEQQKKRRRDISRLSVGDEVMTSGGFYARVVDIQTREGGSVELILEAAPGVRLRATAEAVASITTPADAGGTSAPDERATQKKAEA